MNMVGGVRPDSGTGVLLSAKERREVLGRIRGGWGGAASLKRSVRGGRQMMTGKRYPPSPPETREAVPGTLGEAQRTRISETAMVTLD